MLAWWCSSSGLSVCLSVAVAGSRVNSVHPHVCTRARSYSDYGVVWNVKEVTASGEQCQVLHTRCCFTAEQFQRCLALIPSSLI